MSEPASHFWPREVWHARREAHLARVESLADGFVQRRSRHEKHPVHDFLFTYYSFSPAKLKQWMPQLGVAIQTADEDLQAMPWLASDRFRRLPDGSLTLDQSFVSAHLADLARWVVQLCDNILERAPRFRCFGLHEWAMVYRQTREQIRHQGYELRLAPDELAAFVESQHIGCSHYDAFRFFTPEARPMNSLQPVLETRLEMEQGACLHANMDLYKWASKLWPWAGSDLLGRIFELACEGRDLDMRASPYDLHHLGYVPVCIETAEGRQQYESEQRRLAEKARPLRTELRSAAQTLAETHPQPPAASHPSLAA